MPKMKRNGIEREVNPQESNEYLAAGWTAVTAKTKSSAVRAKEVAVELVTANPESQGTKTSDTTQVVSDNLTTKGDE